MTHVQLQTIRRKFLTYVNAYIDQSGKMKNMMELKREHCAFVAKNARELAERSGWNQSKLYAAEALGLLHDVGRFPQLEEYGTFRDECSINHGLRGGQAIKEEGFLDEIDDDLREALTLAVRYHNDRELKQNISAKALPWLKLIRDADRLDIYRVILEKLKNGELEKHPDVVLHLKIDAPPSPTILEAISNQRPPAYTDLRSVADFLLMLLSWTHQMTLLPAAYDIMRERKIVPEFVKFLPNLPEVKFFLRQLPLQIEE